ncbi:MAG TPA: purine-nucleoside phosphorylase [Acidimicrobiaceae bacterium]|nr:purine-nucleoside phosphorylase [Acidimicrobiaceae bacterium]
MENPFDLAQQAAESVLSLMNARPQVAVVLGSGWAAAADGLGSISAQTPLSSLPGVPEPTVQGHSGLLTLVDVSGIPTLLIGGRNHLYEGHPVATVVHTVRAAVLAGCSTVVLTNAAGSLVPENGPGTPVLLSDQLNLTGHSPMAGQGPPEGFPGRFCDVTNLYSPRLRAAIHDADPTIPEGVYAGMLGGAYETPAEIRMLRTLGADLVGMSTVLESIAAHHLGAEVIGVSLVTNMAAGMGGELSHGEVLEVAQTSTERIVDLIGTIIRSA